MGLYIEFAEHLGKADQLLALRGAREVNSPQFDPTGKEILVCVVENGSFDAAGICYSAQEAIDFDSPRDIRPKRWVLITRQLLTELVALGQTPKAALKMVPVCSS